MGRYVDGTLLNDEKVVYETRLHGIIFLSGALFFILGIIPLASGNRAATLGALMILFGAFLLCSALIRRATSEFVVTNKRVVIKVGWLSRRTIEMNLSKVESVDVSQGLLGRILGYGRIVVVGTGSTREPFANIADPMAFRRAVQAQSA